MGCFFLFYIFQTLVEYEYLGRGDKKMWHRKECFSPFSERSFDWQIQLVCSVTFPFVPRGVGTSFSGKIWNIFLRIILSNEINFTQHLPYTTYCFNMLLLYEHLTTMSRNIISFVSQIEIGSSFLKFPDVTKCF